MTLKKKKIDRICIIKIIICVILYQLHIGGVLFMVCRECGYEVSNDMAFCPSCNKVLQKCGKCGKIISSGLKFCPDCISVNKADVHDDKVNDTKKIKANALDELTTFRASKSKIDAIQTNQAKSIRNNSKSNEDEPSTLECIIGVVAFIFFKFMCEFGWILSFILTGVAMSIAALPKKLLNKASEAIDDSNYQNVQKQISQYKTDSYEKIRKIIIENNGNPDDQQFINNIIDFSEHNPSLSVEDVIKKYMQKNEILSITSKVPKFIKECHELQKRFNKAKWHNPDLYDTIVNFFDDAFNLENEYNNGTLETSLLNFKYRENIKKLLNDLEEEKKMVDKDINEINDIFNTYDKDVEIITSCMEKYIFMKEKILKHTSFFSSELLEVYEEYSVIIEELFSRANRIINKTDTDNINQVIKAINLFVKIVDNIDDFYERLSDMFEREYIGSGLDDWDEMDSEFKDFMDDEDEYSSNEYEEDENDSLGFNPFSGCNDLESLKKRYKSLSKVYHPDMDNGDIEMMQKINAEYDRLRKKYE